MLDREGVVLQALGERAVVLLGEDRRRHEHEHLLAGVGGLERGAQRDLRLAVADVAADEAVHRALGLHVGLDELDRLLLVGGLRVRPGRLELAQPVGVRRVGEARAAAALGVEVQQLAGELLRGAPRAVLHELPALAAELAQGRVAAARADVAADLRELVGGDEDAVVALVLEVEVVARDARDGLRLEAREARDAVVLVDDDVAGAQVGEGSERAAPARGVVAPAGALLAAAAEEAVLGQDGKLQAGGDEAVSEPDVGEAQRVLDAGRDRPPPATTPSGARGCTPPARPRRAAATRRPCDSPSARASRAPARPPSASARRGPGPARGTRRAGRCRARTGARGRARRAPR